MDLVLVSGTGLEHYLTLYIFQLAFRKQLIKVLVRSRRASSAVPLAVRNSLLLV